jgi:hypothetical protein
MSDRSGKTKVGANIALFST